MSARLFWLWLFIAFLSVGCAGNRSISALNTSSKLSELPRATLPVVSEVSDSPIEVVARGYKDALKLIDDQQTNEDILRRLAVLELRKAEDQQIIDASLTPEAIYGEAIHTYRTLLASQQYRADNDKLLYPLAKSLELSGKLDEALQVHNQLVKQFPESQYYSEVQFRRGELLFSGQNYKEASTAYKSVVDRALRDKALPTYERSPFLINAYYMWGWSDFKLGRYTQAMRAFIVVIDNYVLLDDVKSPQQIAPNELDSQSESAEQPGIVASANSAMLEDTFRVMALSFSYHQGAQSIGELLDEVGERDYAKGLYSELGELYLSKKRFLDSTGVYAAFIERYPSSPLAPIFHQHKIDALVAGRFPDKVREEKKVFAMHYAIGRAYWQLASSTTQTFIKSKLDVYIDELASYYHSLAQKSLAQKSLAQQNLLAKDDTPKTSNADISTISDELVRQQFQEAANWYEEWIRSFPDAITVPDKYFLLGETRFEANDYAKAVSAYEVAAYSFGDFEKANEAGYAALLGYDRLIALAPEAAVVNDDLIDSSWQQEETVESKDLLYKIDWKNKKIESALLFAENFVSDTRRLPVLAQTIENLLALKQYDKTIEVAEILLASDAVPLELGFTAWVSSAHASMAKLVFSEAEARYKMALDILVQRTDSTLYANFYHKTLDNYAASIYKQGELANSAGDKVLAASTFMRILQQAPNSSIRVTAQHDASVLLMETEQWQAAIETISDFQRRFPAHEANQSAPARLLQANQSLGNWSAAAMQAMVIADTDPSVEARREALYTAGEFYEKAGDSEQAITVYRRYANEYTQPLAERMEAQYKLVGLYEKAKLSSKRLFWVSKLMHTHDTAAAKTERSTYLAAFAASELAGIDFDAYKRVKLHHPLKESLGKKRKAMEKAINSYEKTAKYGVAKYSTLATQSMGDIYATFAAELMDSERPKNLSALELEQYDILLEEQAYPFEEQAIELFTINVERAWKGTRTDAVKHSFKALAKLLPGRFNKPEIRPSR